MYYEALIPQSLDYYATKYLKNPLQWEAGSLGYNSYPSDDDFWQANLCNISKALLANSTAGTLSRLSNEDCILAYGSGNGNMEGWANLLIVTKDAVTLPYPNTTILLQFRYQEYVSNYTGNNWVCDPDYLIDNNYKCNYKHFAANVSSRTLGPVNANAENPYVLLPSAQWHIDYCLAQGTRYSWEMPTAIQPQDYDLCSGRQCRQADMYDTHPIHSSRASPHNYRRRHSLLPRMTRSLYRPSALPEPPASTKVQEIRSRRSRSLEEAKICFAVVGRTQFTPVDHYPDLVHRNHHSCVPPSRVW